MSGAAEERVVAQEAISKFQYDVKVLPVLEKYLEFQVKTGTYDFDANRHLVKTYVMNQGACNQDCLNKVMIKALMALPQPHFLLISYLIPDKLYNPASIQLTKLANLLETAQFTRFWQECADASSLFSSSSVLGFDNAIRDFIVTTITTTFGSITVTQLCELMNVNDKQVAAYVSQYGWKFVDEAKSVVEFPAKKEQVKIKSTPYEDIPLDQIAKII